MFAILKPISFVASAIDDIGHENTGSGYSTKSQKTLDGDGQKRNIEARSDANRMNVKPDFILHFDNGNSAVVETMGFTTAEYIERKKRTHRFMKELGELIEHRPEPESNEMLREFLCRMSGTHSLSSSN